MAKTFSRLTYDNFTTIGEVNERLPLYQKDLEIVYPLDGSDNNTSSTFELKVENNIIKTIGAAPVSINNVNVTNDHIEFLGNTNSYIELNKDLLKAKNFEIEIKFMMQDFSKSISPLIMCKNNKVGKSENEFAISVTNSHRALYADMYNVQGIYTTKPDLNSSGGYLLSSSGAINKGEWNTVKFTRSGSIVICHINDILTKAFIAEGLFDIDQIFIGQEADGKDPSNPQFDNTQCFKGFIEYIKIKQIEEDSDIERYTLSPKSLASDFTLGFEWCPKLIGTYNLLDLANIKIKAQGNFIKVLVGDIEYAVGDVREGQVYYVALSYDRTLGIMRGYIYNKITNTLLDEFELAININATSIYVINNDSIDNLAVYKKALEKKHIIRNANKKFSMNKEGDLYYIVNETDGNFKIPGNKYHLPLTHDLESDCGAITNTDHGFYADGGMKSGLYKAKAIMDLTAMYSDDAVPYSTGWDTNLHKNSYSIEGWSPGYNDGVASYNIGYHARWVKEGIDSQDVCLRLNNHNDQFGHYRRWLGSNRKLLVNEIWSKCVPGDKVQVVFKAKADVPSIISIGIHRKQKSTNSYGFGGNLKDLKIKDSSWNAYVYETTIDSDWNLDESADLYFYGYMGVEATLWAQDIFIIVNGEIVSPEVLFDKKDQKILIPFSQEINLNYNTNWGVVYKKKIVSLDTNKHYDSFGDNSGLYWGIENDSFVFGLGNTKKTIDMPIDILNEWITIGVTRLDNKLILMIGTKEGVFTGEIAVSQINLFNSLHGYDLMLGGRNSTTYGCGIYKELTIVKDRDISLDAFENYYRNKMSYHKNKLVFNVDIEESTF